MTHDVVNASCTTRNMTSSSSRGSLPKLSEVSNSVPAALCIPYSSRAAQKFPARVELSRRKDFHPAIGSVRPKDTILAEMELSIDGINGSLKFRCHGRRQVCGINVLQSPVYRWKVYGAFTQA